MMWISPLSGLTAFDSLTQVFACPAFTLTQFLACLDRFSVLNLLTGLFAAVPTS
jgi:hypothetical protein